MKNYLPSGTTRCKLPLFIVVAFCYIITFSSGLSAQAYLDCGTFADDVDVITDRQFVDIVDGISYVVADIQTIDPTNGASVFNTTLFAYDENCQEIFRTLVENGDDVTAFGLEVAEDGDIYVFGQASQDGFVTDGSTLQGSSDGFVARYSPTGILEFATLIGSSNNTNGPDRVTNLISYDGGYYTISKIGSDFGSSAPIGVLTTDGTMAAAAPGNFAGIQALYISHFDDDNNLVFATVQSQQNSNFNFNVIRTAVVGESLYYAFPRASDDFTGATNGATGQGGADFFLGGFQPDGTQIFGRFIGGDNSDNADVKLVADDNGVYLAGQTTSSSIEGLNTANGNPSAFVIKTDLNGVTEYARLLAGSGTDLVYDLKIVSGEAFVSGGTSSSDFPIVNGLNKFGGSISYYIAKLGSDGSIVYSTILGSGGLDRGAPTIDVSSTGEATILVPGNGALTTDGTSGTGYVVYKLNPDGTLCQGATAVDGYGLLANSVFATEVVGDTVRAWFTSDMFLTTAGVTTQPESRTNLHLAKVVLCPEVTTAPASVAPAPASQDVCANGLTERITAAESVVSGDDFPVIYDNGVEMMQNDVELSYQWEFSDTPTGPWMNVGGVLGQQQNFSPPPTTQDIYYRRITTTADCCGGQTITTSAVAAVIVGPNTAPVADAGPNLFSCPGEMLTIGSPPNSATGGTPPYMYTWSTGDTDATISVMPSASTVYSLTVTDANGCQQVDQASVVIYSADAGSDVSSCAGDAVQIGGAPLASINIVTATNPALTGEYNISYSWSPTTALSCTDCPLPLASPAAVTDYTLTVELTDPAGNTCMTTDEVTVEVQDGPNSPLGPDQVICLGETATLGQNTGSTFNFSFSPGNLLTSTATESTTFDPGNVMPPFVNPVTIVRTATENGCAFEDRVTVAVIEARAGVDGCGPRVIGEPDRTPGIEETYAWRRLSDPSLTTTTSGMITGPTDQALTTVSGVTDGQVAYEVSVSFTLNGATATCLDTVIVPVCGCVIDVEPVEEGCPSGIGTTLVATAGDLYSADPDDFFYAWTPEEGLDVYQGRVVTLTDDVARTYTVTMTSPFDETFMCSETIEVNNPAFAPPPLTVADNVTACAGDMVAIGDPGANTAGGLMYEWAPITGLDDPNSGNPTLTVTGSATYVVTVTDPSTTCTNIDTVEVTTPQVADAGGDVNFCNNAVVPLGNNQELPGYTYQWTGAPANLFIDGTTPTDAMVSFNAAATFALTLTVTSPGGVCVTTDQVQLTRRELPPPVSLRDFSFCPSQTDPVIIGFDNGEGSMAGANLVPDNTGQDFSYSWSPANLLDDPTVRNPQLATPLPNADVTFMVELIGLGGCNQVSELIAGTVPSPPIVATGPVTCVDEPIAIGSPANEPASATITYQWSPATDLDDPTSPNPIFTPASAGVIEFTVVKTDNSQNPVCAVENTVSANVQGTPDFSLDPVVLCPGATAQIGIPTFAGFSFQWSPATGLDDPNISNPTFTGSASQDYVLTLITPTGCIGEYPTSITVIDQPEIMVTEDDISVCYADQTSADLTPTVTTTPATTSTYSYAWSADEGSFSDDNSLNTTYFFPQPGTFDLTLTVTDVSNGCSVDATIPVTASQLEESCTATAASTTVALGEAIELMGSGGGTAYAWIGPNGFTDDTQNPTIAAATEDSYGTYELTVTYASGCTTTCSVTIFEGPATLMVVNDCQLNIQEELVSCILNADGSNSFEVSFQVAWNYAEATDETIEIMVDGQLEQSFTPTANSGSENFGPYTFVTPRFNLPVAATFSDDASCGDAKILDLIACTEPCSGNADEVGGNVFVDGNNDGADAGAMEVGQANVLVRVYDCNEMLLCEVYTNADGNWSCDAANPGDSVRVEYTTPLSPELSESFAGTNNGTSTQFVIAGTCDANYGVIDNTTCSEETAKVLIGCFSVGNPLGNTDPVLFYEDYLRTDVVNDPNVADDGVRPGSANTLFHNNILATTEELGAIYGMAIDDTRQTAFLSAFQKRGAGYGPGADGNTDGSTGAIYQVDLLTGDITVLIDLDPGSSANPDPALYSTGTNPHPNTTTDWTCDWDSHQAVGRTSWADIDISDDGSTLYAVNLFDRGLYEIDAMTGAIIGVYPVPGAVSGISAAGTPTVWPATVNSCTNDTDLDIQPFALTYHEGTVYVGLTCTALSTAQLSASLNDLYQYVFTFDPASKAYSAAPVESAPLDRGTNRRYLRAANDADYAAAEALINDGDPSTNPNGQAFIANSPVLADIEFDGDDMLLSIRNDGGDRNARPLFNYSDCSGDPVPNAFFGTIERACAAGGGQWDHESTGACGPGAAYEIGTNPGVQFYYDQSFGVHDVGPGAALAQLPGADEFLATAYPGAAEGHVTTWSHTTFAWSRTQAVYETAPAVDPNFGKAQGLTDIELFCLNDQIQIGNYAWIDTDGDGLQDPCEPPLPGLTVKLYAKPPATAPASAPQLLATTVTDATGNYYFAGRDLDDATWEAGITNDTIQRDSLYFIAFCGDGAFNTTDNAIELGGMLFCPSPANAGQAPNDDQNDSDITVQTVGADMVPAYCTTGDDLTDGTNHTFDAGFKPLECNVEIVDPEIICNDSDDFTLSFGVAYRNTIPSNTMIEVLLDGSPVTGSPFTATDAAGNFDVEAIMVDDPAFNVPLVVRFVEDNACNEAQLLDFIACTPTCDDRAGNANIVGGNAFVDGNNDGTNDSETGQPNVLVRVYDCAEMLVCEVYTDENGDWSCDNAMAGDTFRVEYTTPLSPELEEGTAGPDNGTGTQFVTGGMCDADYGLYDPQSECLDPVMVTPCYVQDNNLTGPNSGEVAIGAVPVGLNSDDVANTKASMTYAAPASAIGTTWGTAFRLSGQRLFASSYLKRKTGFGPDGNGGTTTGGIYEIAEDGTARLFVDLQALGLDTGTDPHPQTGDACGPSARFGDPGEVSEDVCWFHDFGTLERVSKMSLGDLQFSPDFSQLWTINLNTRELISIEVSEDENVLPTVADVMTYPLSGLFADANSGADDWRPFAMGVRGRLMYIGVTATAESSQNSADLDALLYEFDPADPTGTLSLIARFDLDYNRDAARLRNCTISQPGDPANGTSFFCGSTYQPWTSNYDPTSPRNSVQPNGSSELQYYVRNGGGVTGGKHEIVHPMPLFSDIEFTTDGKLLLGIRDRTPDMFGDGVGSHLSLDSEIIYEAVSSGDLLIAAPNGGAPSDGFTLESSGTVGNMTRTATPSNNNTGATGGEGPGGDEYFDDNNDADQAPGDPFTISSHVHDETSFGGVAYNPFTGRVIMSSMNPTNNTSSAGLQEFDVATGTQVGGTRYYGRDETFDFGKAAGLGDVTLLCEESQPQIGNYAWLDTDADGLQDPCEPPLAGLAVKLYRKNSDDPDAPILIATDTTDATGNYYFSSASAADGDAMQNWIGTDADTTVNRDSLYFIAFCGQSGFDTGTNSLIVDGVSLCPSPANMGQQAASDATDGSADQNDSDITVQDVAGLMIPAYCTTAGELADGTNHTFDAGFKPLEFDLALTKKISTLETDNSFRPGDQVIFDIEVINQGDVTAFDIVVGDSIPVGMTYDASATTATGTAVLTSVGGATIDFVNDYMLANDGSFTVDSLPAMDTVVFQVAVTIDAIGTSQAARPLINYAEIQSADNDEDPTNTPPEDVDSTPNDNFSDDPGGVPGGETDDQDDGDGTGMPGDDGPGDEDDADPALVPIYDIALTKIIDPASIDPNANYSPGDLIVFNLNVANQANDTIGGFTVTDYLPCGYTFNSAATSNGADNTGWSLSGMQLTFTTTDDLLPNGGTQVQLVLTYQDDLCGGTSTVDTAFINRAEISEFTNTAGDPVDDFDSVPDDIPGNDPGGMVDSPSDNEVGGNGTGTPGDDVDTTDEDDSDPASLRVFDLAIFKVVDSTDAANVGPYVFGDVVKYQIGVVEQGNLPATDVTVKDITPPGLRFDPSLGMNATPQGGGTWADNGDGTVSLDISDFSTLNTAGTADLGGGDTALICIWLEVVVPGGAIDDNSFVNYAGIEEATFDDPQLGTPVTVTGDGDSDYDLEVGDDTGDGVGTPDDNETTDNTPGDDIDSQDPAFIEVLLGVAVGDTTFIDVNMDGLQDAGDQALPGVTVTVYDATTMMPVTTDVFGQPYSNTRQTDALGAYLFDSLPSGNYYVEFDISTAPNGDLYDYTTPNVGGNAGASDSLDSDVTPAAPTDDVANSDETGLIPPGDTVLTLDAGVVCAIMVTVADPSTICSTQDVDLTQGASIVPDRLGGFWTTTGTGTFFDAGGTALTANPITGGYAFGTAVRYEPSAADGRAGEVTFTLTTNDPANLAPASVCTPQSASVTITILNVDCGSFFWDGGE